MQERLETWQGPHMFFLLKIQLRKKLVEAKADFMKGNRIASNWHFGR